jgi:hypothetical protein
MQTLQEMYHYLSDECLDNIRRGIAIQENPLHRLRSLRISVQVWRLIFARKRRRQTAARWLAAASPETGAIVFDSYRARMGEEIVFVVLNTYSNPKSDVHLVGQAFLPVSTDKNVCATVIFKRLSWNLHSHIRFFLVPKWGRTRLGPSYHTRQVRP